MTLRFPRQSVLDTEARWPGFRAAVEKVGAWEGDLFVVEAKAWAGIWGAAHRAARRAKEPQEPTMEELAHNFGAAMARWAGAGFATVARETYATRTAACGGCEFWDGGARWGLGTCKAPGCGCTRFKRWLATERCPLGKWPGEPLQRLKNSPASPRI